VDKTLFSCWSVATVFEIPQNSSELFALLMQMALYVPMNTVSNNHSLPKVSSAVSGAHSIHPENTE